MRACVRIIINHSLSPFLPLSQRPARELKSRRHHHYPNYHHDPLEQTLEQTEQSSTGQRYRLRFTIKVPVNNTCGVCACECVCVCVCVCVHVRYSNY